MQNGYQLFTPKGVWQQLLHVVPTPQSPLGQWCWRQRHYAPQLVQLAEQKLPACLRQTLLRQLLQQVFGAVAARGELDFLLGRRLGVEVPDLQMHYELGLDSQRRFWLAQAGRSVTDATGPDAAKKGALVQGAIEAASTAEAVLFRANSNELLLLLTQQADPDTLFFQRRLSISGDTELALQLKNYLDTLEPDNLLPSAVMVWLQEIVKTKQATMQN